MKQKMKYIFIIVMIHLLISPVSIIALESGSVEKREEYVGYLLEKEAYSDSFVVVADAGDCRGAILGDPNDENSVSWLLQKIFNYVKVIGPIMVILLSSFDFIKVIVKSDDESFQKAKKKLLIRIILAILLFMVPSLVQAALDVFGITSDPTCGIR